MSTGSTWADLFPQRVLDLAVLDLGLAEPVRSEVRTGFNDLIGLGGVFSAYATFTHAANRLTLNADRTGWTGDGRRLVLDNAAGLGFASIPYEANGATTYHLAARYNEKPTGAILGFEGTPGWTYWKEAIGELLTPSSIVSTGGGTTLRVHVAGTLSAAMKWTNAAHVRPVTVWKVDPVTGTADAVFSGDLETDGAGLFFVDVPHTFGQGTSPSTTAADYALLVEGLTIGAVGLATDPAYVYLGSVLAGVHSSAGERILQPLSYWTTLFAVEHDAATGAHTDVTARSLTGSGSGLGGTQDLEVEAENMRIKDRTTNATLAILATLAGSVVACETENGGARSGLTIDRDTKEVDLKSDTGDTRASTGIALGANANPGGAYEGFRYAFEGGVVLEVNLTPKSIAWMPGDEYTRINPMVGLGGFFSMTNLDAGTPRSVEAIAPLGAVIGTAIKNAEIVNPRAELVELRLSYGGGTTGTAERVILYSSDKGASSNLVSELEVYDTQLTDNHGGAPIPIDPDKDYWIRWSWPSLAASATTGLSIEDLTLTIVVYGGP